MTSLRKIAALASAGALTVGLLTACSGSSDSQSSPNGSASSKQVTITVDGNPNSVTINGNKAQLVINNPALGQHTVELTDPAGCFAPVITNCN